MIGTPRASKRRAKTPDPSPSWPFALPGDDEAARSLDVDARADLPVRRVRVDGDLARERVARGVVAPREDAFLIAVLIGALPRDDELASQVHRDARVHLVARRRRVHDELAAERSTGRAKSLSRYSEARAVSGEAHPDDHEIAGGVHARRRSLLRTGGECVHRKLASQSDSVFVEPLPEDAVRGPVLVALPGDDEVAVRAAGDGGELLLSRGVCVDLEIGRLGNTLRVVHARDDAELRSVLADAVPRDDNAAVGRHRRGGMRLVICRVGVHLELGSERRRLRDESGCAESEQKHQHRAQEKPNSHGRSLLANSASSAAQDAFLTFVARILLDRGVWNLS